MKKFKSILNVSIISVLITVGYTKTAEAILNIDVMGTPGSGSSTWTFSGSSTINEAGSLRTSAVNGFNGVDSIQFVNFISDVSIQDVLFNATGGSTILTVGSNTANITTLFLDQDGDAIGDDIGLRVDSPFTTTVGEVISWSGTQTYNIDLNQLNEGSFSNPSGSAGFVSDGEATLNISSVQVPFELSPTLGLLMIGGIWGISKLKKIKTNQINL